MQVFDPAEEDQVYAPDSFKEYKPPEYGHNQVRGVKNLGKDKETSKLAKYAEPDAANARAVLGMATPEVEDSQSPIPNVVFESGG